MNRNKTVLEWWRATSDALTSRSRSNNWSSAACTSVTSRLWPSAYPAAAVPQSATAADRAPRLRTSSEWASGADPGSTAQHCEGQQSLAGQRRSAYLRGHGTFRKSSRWMRVRCARRCDRLLCLPVTAVVIRWCASSAAFAAAVVHPSTHDSRAASASPAVLQPNIESKVRIPEQLD